MSGELLTLARDAPALLKAEQLEAQARELREKHGGGERGEHKL